MLIDRVQSSGRSTFIRELLHNWSGRRCRSALTLYTEGGVSDASVSAEGAEPTDE